MTKINDISLEAYALIAKAGILLGQLNPNKDPDRLVKALLNMQVDAYMNLEDNNDK